MSTYTELLTRHASNPILVAADWPYPAHVVFNPGATRLEDGTTLLLCRVEDRRGISHLCAARSANGIDGWHIDAQPTLQPEPETYPEETWGVEDPRITYLPELEQYAVVYTAYSTRGPGVSLALTKDFRTFERLGMIRPPEDKDATLLPRRIDGQWVLVHRSVTSESANIWMSYSTDLRVWRGGKEILWAKQGPWWDANKIGLSPPLIETPEGWLMLYHGVRRHVSGGLYRVGLALFSLADPSICIRRGDMWIMGPETPYERVGDVPNVVFPGGFTLQDDGDTLYLYYGAADTCIGLAIGSVRTMLEWLRDQDDARLTSA